MLFRRDFQNAVEVQPEADQDLVAGGNVGEALQQELADELVVADVGVLALVDRDHRLLLPVDGRGEHLRTRGGQRRIAMDHRREAVFGNHAMQFAQGRNAQGVRRDVDQDRPDVNAVDQAALHGRAHGDAQVGIDLGMQLSPQRRSSRRWTSGVRLAPPTRITLSICWAFKRASSSD